MSVTPSPRPGDSSRPLVVEAKIIPLPDADTERRDQQLSAIVNLLQGVLARRQGSELRSRREPDLI